MNQQNINNLVTYFKQNLTTPPQTLINNCLKSGYLQEDINGAVNILNSQNIPSNDLPPHSNNISLTIAIVLIVAVMLIGVGIGFYMTLSGKNIDLPFFTGKSIKPSPILNISGPAGTGVTTVPSKMITGAPISISDPLKAFADVFNVSDYKISSSGKVENKENKTDEKGNPYSSSSAMDLNNTIFYTQKGSLVRYDSIDPQRPQSFILKGVQVYSLNSGKKTFDVTSTSGPMGQFIVSMFKTGFPPISLLEDHVKTPFVFEKIGESLWQTNWKYKNALSPGEEKPVKIKITLDPNTKLITAMSYNFTEGQPWQDLTFAYEKLANIDTYLAPPPDYTEEKSQP